LQLKDKLIFDTFDLRHTQLTAHASQFLHV